MERMLPSEARRRTRSWDFWSVVTGGASLLLLVFLIYPLISVFMSALGGREREFVFLKNYVTFFTRPYYYESLQNSLIIGILVTAIATPLGVLMAYLYVRCRLPGKPLIATLAVTALMSPPFVGAYAWILLLGRGGIITRSLAALGVDVPAIYGWHGIIFVLSLQTFPLVFLLVSAGLRAIDQSLEDAASNLGASRMRVFGTVMLPMITPAVTTGALLVFMSSIADFGTPILLGQRIRVLPTLIYTEFVNELGGNPSLAAAMSTILVSLSTVALLIQRYAAFRKSYATTAITPLSERRLSPLGTAASTGLVYGWLGLALAPQAVVVVTSFFTPRGPLILPQFSLESYRFALYWAPRAITNSFLLSALAAVLIMIFSVLLGYALVRRRSPVTAVLDGAMMLPYAIPGTVLAVGLILAFNKPPLILTGTWMILVIAYFIRRLPYGIRACIAGMQQVDSNLEDASVNLGVSPARTFLVIVLPLILPAVVAGAVLSWVTVIRELSATIILYYGPWSTMTVNILTQVTSGSYGLASSLASILILSVFIPTYLINRYVKGASGRSPIQM